MAAVAGDSGGGAGFGGEGPDIPAPTIVHRVKSKMGYTEMHAPAPGFGEDVRRKETSSLRHQSQHFLLFYERGIVHLHPDPPKRCNLASGNPKKPSLARASRYFFPLT